MKSQPVPAFRLEFPHVQTSSGISSRGFRLIELLVVIAIIAVLVAILLPAVQAGPRSGPRFPVQEQPQAVGRSALHNYHETHAIFLAGAAELRPA